MAFQNESAGTALAARLLMTELLAMLERKQILTAADVEDLRTATLSRLDQMAPRDAMEGDQFGFARAAIDTACG